jgi:hypothetical protein
MDLYGQYDCSERSREISGWIVLLGVFLEVFETIAELKRHPMSVDFRPTWMDETTFGRFIPAQKPTWQKWLAFLGWLVLFAGLFGESFFANRSRQDELLIRSSAERQIEALKKRTSRTEITREVIPACHAAPSVARQC